MYIKHADKIDIRSYGKAIVQLFYSVPTEQCDVINHNRDVLGQTDFRFVKFKIKKTGWVLAEFIQYRHQKQILTRRLRSISMSAADHVSIKCKGSHKKMPQDYLKIG